MSLMAVVRTEKGTILNLLSALNRDNGSTGRGYPSNYNKSDAGSTNKGRCRMVTTDPDGCYTAMHIYKLQLMRVKLVMWQATPLALHRLLLP